MTDKMTQDNAQDNAEGRQEVREHEGNEDSRKLAKDWQQGKGNTKDSNFVTPGDAENTETFEEVMEKKNEAPAFTGEYKK